MSGSPIFFPSIRKLYFQLFSITPYFLPYLASAYVNSLSYLNPHGFTRPCWCKSVPVQQLQAVPTPHLEEFETCMEILRDMYSSNWLVSRNRPENPKKKVNTKIVNRRKYLQWDTARKRFGNAIKTSMRNEPSSCL